jgi:hypothetical protein
MVSMIASSPSFQLHYSERTLLHSPATGTFVFVPNDGEPLIEIPVEIRKEEDPVSWRGYDFAFFSSFLGRAVQIIALQPSFSSNSELYERIRVSYTKGCLLEEYPFERTASSLIRGDVLENIEKLARKIPGSALELLLFEKKAEITSELNRLGMGTRDSVRKIRFLSSKVVTSIIQERKAPTLFTVLLRRGKSGFYVKGPLVGTGTYKSVVRLDPWVPMAYAGMNMLVMSKIRKNLLEQYPNLTREVESEYDIVTFLNQQQVPSIVQLWKILYKNNGKNSLRALMEYCDRGTLHDCLQKNISSEERRELCLALAQSVASMHEAGVCHLDLKSTNILLKTCFSSVVLRLGDFGAAVRLSKVESSSTEMKSSYPAPEMYRPFIRNESFSFSPALDLWALAEVLHYVMYGKYLLMGLEHKSREYEKKLLQLGIKTQELVSSPDLLKQCIGRLLSIDPGQRPTARVVFQQLQRWAHEEQLKENMALISL